MSPEVTAPAETVTGSGAHRGSILPPAACSVYIPVGRENENFPDASDLRVAKTDEDPCLYTLMLVAYGLSAQPGSGGFRMTGHVGPSNTCPVTPEVAGGTITGHSANSQLGPVRPTADPSGQSFASVVHAW